MSDLIVLGSAGTLSDRAKSHLRELLRTHKGLGRVRITTADQPGIEHEARIVAVEENWENQELPATGTMVTEPTRSSFPVVCIVEQEPWMDRSHLTVKAMTEAIEARINTPRGKLPLFVGHLAE